MQNAKEFLEELLNAGFIPEELEKETEKILGITECPSCNDSRCDREDERRPCRDCEEN